MPLVRLEFALSDCDLTPAELRRASDLTSQLAELLETHWSRQFTRSDVFDLTVYPQGTGYVVAIEAKRTDALQKAVGEVLGAVGAIPIRVTGKPEYSDDALNRLNCYAKQGLLSAIRGRYVVQRASRVLD